MNKLGSNWKITKEDGRRLSMVTNFSLLMPLILLSCQDNRNSLNSGESIIRAEPRGDRQLTINARLPQERREAFARLLSSVARNNRLRLVENRTPHLPSVPEISNIISFDLEGELDSISAINPFSAEDFIITVRTRRAGESAQQALDHLSQEVLQGLRREGIEVKP